MSKFLSFLLITTLFASCSHIVATNFPGEAQQKLPESWKGNYSIEFPSYLSMVMENSDDPKKSRVQIMTTMIRWTHGEEKSDYSTSDSLRFSKLNGINYLSLANSHNQYTVFKVVKVEDGLDLYSLTADDDVKKEKLLPYFKNVKELETSDKDDETGINLYEVTIKDDKLDEFYRSGIPAKDPIKLRRIN